MRIGVAGKGGAGKTFVAGVLARTLARRGRRVIALDCDSDPNLALGVGLDEAAADALLPLLDQSSGARRLPDDLSPTELVERYAAAGPDGLDLVLAARAERAGGG
ncbi:MAG TPA: AAA family ATPase [Nitriliruptorales bacterium]|nr:AAA family ATPase [Nitriliruptorales bacterium]